MVTNPYVPILKWKNAERDALKDLPDSLKNCVIPLFEIVQPIQLSANAKKAGVDSTEEELITILSSRIPQDIMLCWGDAQLFYIDFSLIHKEETRLAFAKNFMNNASLLHLEPVPVINLSVDNKSYIAELIRNTQNAKYNRLCLRFTSGRLANISETNNSIDSIINKYAIPPERISIIIDLKEFTDPDIYSRAIGFSQELMHLTKYHQLTIACGAFPKDMSAYKADGDDNHRKRDDWLNWKEKALDTTLARRPSFGDYTIRHPIYDEVAMKYLSSPTIKYTTEDRWKFYKGEYRKQNHYLAYAKVLRDSDDYYGPDFSAGDKYIELKSLYFSEHAKEIGRDEKISGTGNAEQWIRAGINHHISVVIDQLSKLADKE